MSSSLRHCPSAPASFPRYTTFREGELHQALRKLDPEGKYPLPGLSGTSNKGSHTNTSTRRTRLIWNHECAVTFPDGREGTCRYTRGGPEWHVFRYEYKGAESIELLPVQNVGEKLENTYPAIEAAANENAAAAFAHAIVRERKEYFKRASENASRKARPEKYQMSAGRAKKIAGKYTLCVTLATKMLPVSALFDTLEEANTAWQAKNDKILVIACANRLDRCWEKPRFNPLHADLRYREALNRDVSVAK